MKTAIQKHLLRRRRCFFRESKKNTSIVSVTVFLVLLINLCGGISNGSIKFSAQINELSTAEYIYNSIAKAYEEDGTTIRYYVAYEGTIKAGIDFNDIGVEISEDEKGFFI
ncbi:MAG: DUF4230 domain-containing protein [Acetatifactor sp.]|nr:DUF4230 domain-containing protein [Acetatifactor sp.]MDE7043515.1 DUF4230 domain-containing protein [Acetatifactor sp.]